MTVYAVYGMRISTDFPMSLPKVSGASDVVVTRGADIHDQPTVRDGVILLDYAEGDDHWYTIARRADRSLLFRIFGLCDFEIDQNRTAVGLRLLAGQADGMASIVTSGALSALLSYLSGHGVLHASGVTHDGHTIGFMGRSGQGKSTLAALLCTAGAELVTDDVLPVIGVDPVTVALGSPEVRLRPMAATLAPGLDLDEADHERASADRRRLVTFREIDTHDESRRLEALFIPAPNRQDRLEMERLGGREALLAVMTFPRLMGWRDPAVLQRQFVVAGALAHQVPVFVAHVPWGPPFRPDVVDAIWAAATGSVRVPALAGV